MKAVCSFRTSGMYNPVTVSHYQNLRPWPQCCENLKFYICCVGQCLFMLRCETAWCHNLCCAVKHTAWHHIIFPFISSRNSIKCVSDCLIFSRNLHFMLRAN